MSKLKSDLIEPCSHSGVGRRDFFDRLVKVGITGAIVTLAPDALVARVLTAAPPPKQNDWRNCRRCRTLFYNGYPNNKGLCPLRGRHDAEREPVRDYKLTYNSRGPGQRDWRFCNKCNSLFWNGYPKKGVCPGGGGHFAQGYNFTLRFDAAAPGERVWRFCTKCEVLFYNFEGQTGTCAAGGGHAAAGYVFVLDSGTPFDEG